MYPQKLFAKWYICEYGLVVEKLSLNPLASQASCFIGGAFEAKGRIFLIGEME